MTLDLLVGRVKDRHKKRDRCARGGAQRSERQPSPEDRAGPDRGGIATVRAPFVGQAAIVKANRKPRSDRFQKLEGETPAVGEKVRNLSRGVKSDVEMGSVESKVDESNERRAVIALMHAPGDVPGLQRAGAQ